MLNHLLRCTNRVARFAFLSSLVLLLPLGVQHRFNAAQASLPSAVELADHALITPAAVEDEGPYRLIDPVGPGGLTRQAAIGEVLASTMQGGSYGDHQYYGPLGPQIYVPPAPAPHGGYNPPPHGGRGWERRP